MTKVLFLIEKPEGNLPCNVFAYFPEIRHNKVGGMFTCYAHIGQHSACHESYAKDCREADFNEYSDLLRELIGQGYKDLQILNKQVFQYHRKPTEGEIKFGEGAIHHRAFTAIEAINPKTGDLKKRLKADDGLIYTR